ncbi:MAG: ABC transporter ATP-binding protein [Pyrinomonadaceae bacterium]|nr:ABC transporter ATP-binding protein [Sphingobacteriaceae bacterium]
MSNTVIKVENLSKQYRLGQVGTGSLSHDINRLWHRVRGNEDPYLKIGEENKRDSKGNSDYVWALKDINFDIQQGDRVGIIGRNGAGKSTLLKILSRTTSPTTGSVKIKGRVASLLEVGTGFHPDLSGRDNIFLNGAILGMSKGDIKSRFDEIVDFAGVERYIDTPVKRYSSGMYVRLAFAVAAHLESDILIVDEVLAVGDAEFQKKCLGKMGDVSKSEGRTILFVSHNMASIKKLCSKGILLSNGSLNLEGSIDSAINRYLDQNVNTSELLLKSDPSLIACVIKVQLRNLKNEKKSEITISTKWKICIEFQVHSKISGIICGVGVVNIMDVPLKTTWHKPLNLLPGKYYAEFIEDQTDFALGKYVIHIGLSAGGKNIQFIEKALAFEIVYGNELLNNNILKLESSTGAIINQMQSFVISND